MLVISKTRGTNFVYLFKTTTMYTALKGVYENGVLRLLEPAPDVNRSEVLVTFLNDSNSETKVDRQPGGLLRLNALKGKDLSIPDDFNNPIDDLKDYT